MRFETRYTYDFVKRFLPGDRCRILEVGCGSGELAAALSRDGHTVIAIDSDLSPSSLRAGSAWMPASLRGRLLMMGNLTQSCSLARFIISIRSTNL